MPTGFRAILNNTTINGVTYNGAVDLENVFHLRNGQPPAANVGFRSPSGRDLSDWFVPLSAGGTPLEVDTGFRTAAGVDVRQIYAKAGTLSAPPGGGGPGGGGCLPYETPVPLYYGGFKALGDLRPGDVVIGFLHPTMIDASEPDWRSWRISSDEISAGEWVPATVECAMHGEYPWHYLVNGELRATYEHEFLIRRGDEWGWYCTEELQPGDAFLAEDGSPVVVETIERVDEPMRIANLNVETVDSFLFVAFGDLAVLSHNSEIKT